MKKFIIFIPILMFFIVSCAPAAPAEVAPPAADNDTEVTQPATEPPAEEGGTRVALIPSLGGIDDGSFNQGSFEGMVQFAQGNNIGFTYIQPIESSDAGYINAMELAINGGAQLIVAPGFSFATAMYQAQDLFPDTMFILVDTAPENPETWEPRIESNVVALSYAEEQAGFLAGYAVVIEGHRSLGFIGGLAMPPVSGFGHGFIQGAEYAAISLGLSPGDVTVIYHYAMTFDPEPSVFALASAWYNDGVEVIFAAAGGAGFAVMQAAETHGGLVVGVDIDQAGDSPSVITSALKGLHYSVYTAVGMYFEGNFPGGQSLRFAADNYGVGLSMDTSRFANFTQANYEAIFNRLATGEVVPTFDVTLDANQLDVTYVTVILV